MLESDVMKNRTVLFVDDEPDTLSSLKGGLLYEDYRCLFAINGTEALSILESEEICVIVSDMKMPVMDGLKLLKFVREKYPNIVRIVLSDYTQLPQVLAAVDKADIFKFITKPWKMEEEFIFTIRHAIEYYELHEEREELRIALEKMNLMYQNIMRATEKKLRYDKLIFESIKKIGEFTFSSLKAYSKKKPTQETLKEQDALRYINLMQELYEDYLSIIQTSSLSFRQKNLAMDLESYLSKLPNVLSTTVKTDGKEERNYYGNYRIIFFIIHSVLKYMFIPVDKYILVCRIIDQPTEVPGKLPILLELDFESRLGVDKNSETWETVKGFIGEVCKILDSKIEMHMKETNISLNLIINFFDSDMQAKENIS